MDDVDRRMLAFVGAHRFVLGSQIAICLRLESSAAAERVTVLRAEQMLRTERFAGLADGLVRVTAAGLRAIGSRMPLPGFDLTGSRHELGVVWLWLAARDGAFGATTRVLSRREMETLDRAAREAGGGDGAFAVPMAAGRSVGEGLYPDVMVVHGGGQAALHLLIWPHRSIDLDVLLSGHRERPQVALMRLFLVDDEWVGMRVLRAAERHGVRDRVRVQRARLGGSALPAG